MFLLLSVLVLLPFLASVLAESHTVTFANKCGFGTPQLLINGKVVSSGQPYTSKGTLPSAIAYLQTKNATNAGCDFNGERCTLIELNLVNPTVPGGGSSSDISLIPTHAFNVPAGFQYYGADGTCDGLGAFCGGPSCNTAFYVPDDTTVQRACQLNNINLLITFCGGSPTTFSSAVTNSLRSLSSGGTSSNNSGSNPNPSSSSVTSATSTKTAETSQKAPINVASTGAVTSSSSTATSSSAPASDPSQCTSRRRRRSIDVSEIVELPTEVLESIARKRAASAHSSYRRRRSGRF